MKPAWGMWEREGHELSGDPVWGIPREGERARHSQGLLL